MYFIPSAAPVAIGMPAPTIPFAPRFSQFNVGYMHLIRLYLLQYPPTLPNISAIILLHVCIQGDHVTMTPVMALNEVAFSKSCDGAPTAVASCPTER